MRIWRSSNFKFYRETVFGYLLAFLCLFSSYAMYIESTASLDKAARFSGRILEIGIGHSKSSVARFGAVNKKILTIKMAGLQGSFFIYNPMQKYDHYLDVLQLGDSVTIVYGKPHKRNDYRELFEVSKENMTILKFEKFTRRAIIGAIITLVGGLLMCCWISYNVYKRVKSTTLRTDFPVY